LLHDISPDGPYHRGWIRIENDLMVLIKNNEFRAFKNSIAQEAFTQQA